MSEKTEWLAGLKVGDPVIVESTHIGGIAYLATVERLTATQIIVGGTRARYRRQDGYRIGPYSYHRSWIEEPTPEARAEIRQTELLDRFRRRGCWDKLPLDTLEAVAELLEKAKR